MGQKPHTGVLLWKSLRLWRQSAEEEKVAVNEIKHVASVVLMDHVTGPTSCHVFSVHVVAWRRCRGEDWHVPQHQHPPGGAGAAGAPYCGLRKLFTCAAAPGSFCLQRLVATATSQSHMVSVLFPVGEPEVSPVTLSLYLRSNKSKTWETLFVICVSFLDSMVNKVWCEPCDPALCVTHTC